MFFTNHAPLIPTFYRSLDRVNGNECDLREKEGQWAYRLKTLTPDGLNTNDFFILKIGRRACGIDWDSLYSLAFVLARANTVCFFARAKTFVCVRQRFVYLLVCLTVGLHSP